MEGELVDLSTRIEPPDQARPSTDRSPLPATSGVRRPITWPTGCRHFRSRATRRTKLSFAPVPGPASVAPVLHGRADRARAHRAQTAGGERGSSDNSAPASADGHLRSADRALIGLGLLHRRPGWERLRRIATDADGSPRGSLATCGWLGTRLRAALSRQTGGIDMARAGLLWLLGIPIPILLIMWAFGWL